MSDFLFLILIIACAIYVMAWVFIWLDDFDSFTIGDKPVVFFFEPNWGQVNTKHAALIALLKSIANIPLSFLTPLTYISNWLIYYTRLPDDQTQIERLKKWADKNKIA